MKHIFIFLIAISFGTTLLAQTPDFSIPAKADNQSDIDEFDYQLLEEVILVMLNKERFDQDVEVLKERIELKETALDMANLVAYPEPTKLSLAEYSISHGGTKNVSEYPSRSIIKDGATMKTYRQIAIDLIAKWKEQVCFETDLFSDFNTFIGVASSLNYENYRIYASIVLGNSTSFAMKLNDNAKKYISSKTNVLPYDEKICKKLPQLNELYPLHDGLKVNKNEVIFEYDNIKFLKRFIKTDEDGLMLDVVQNDQYDCQDENIIDLSQVHRGLVSKPVVASSIYPTGKGSISVKLGDLPKGVTDNYELNLIIISKNHACRNIYKTTVTLPNIHETFDVDFFTYLDPKFVNEKRINYNDIPQKMDRDFCWRADSKYYQTEFNTYNCVLTKLKYSNFADVNDYFKANTQLDGLYGKAKINQDTLKLLDAAIQIKAINTTGIDEATQKQAYDRLVAIELPQLSAKNRNALISVYMQQKDYLRALSLLDEIIFDKNISEDLLFSYISLSSLYQERVLSATFAKAMQLAEARNNERLCNLFDEGQLTRQMFDNFKIKGLYCEKCYVDRSIRK